MSSIENSNIYLGKKIKFDLNSPNDYTYENNKLLINSLISSFNGN